MPVTSITFNEPYCEAGTLWAGQWSAEAIGSQQQGKLARLHTALSQLSKGTEWGIPSLHNWTYLNQVCKLKHRIYLG